MIMSRLKSSGLRPYNGRDDLTNGDPMLIDATSISKAELHKLKKHMVHQSDRVVILLAAPDTLLLQNAIILTHESQLSSIPARLEVARRKQSRLREVSLRAKLLALSAELKALDVSTTSALTALTARDYLTSQNFSCVLVDFEGGATNALAFLQHFSDDHLLSSVPVFALVQPNTDLSLEQQAALANATEIINTDRPTIEIADTVSMLAEYHKASTPMAPSAIKDSRINDRITGLFTFEYLRRHLQNQIDSAQNLFTPISFLTLQFSSPVDDNAAARKALPELAKYILAEMRQTDCPGRIDWSTIGISLPDTPYAGGVRIAQRLVERLGGADLSVLDTPLGHGGALSWRVIEKRRYHSAEDMLQAATKGPQTRITQAA